MAEFLVRITTPARSKPTTRPADVEERAAIQGALLQIVGAVSNVGAYEGTVSGGKASGAFEYVADDR